MLNRNVQFRVPGASREGSSAGEAIVPAASAIGRAMQPFGGAFTRRSDDPTWDFFLSFGDDLACCAVRKQHAPKQLQRRDHGAAHASDASDSSAAPSPTPTHPPAAARAPSAGAQGAKELRARSLKRGMTSFVASDPRRLICDFLKPGDSRGPLGYLKSKHLARRSRIVEPDDSHFFGVFRPTSREAINMMMMGRATGKALNIKGKSAKRGQLTGFVPFLQISAEEHKPKVRTCESQLSWDGHWAPSARPSPPSSTAVEESGSAGAGAGASRRAQQ